MTTYEWGRADRIERAAFRALLRVPEAIRRRIDLRPRVIDGHRLDPDTNVGLQILTRLPNKEFDELLVPEARREMALRSWMFAGDPTPVGATRDLTIPGPAGGIPGPAVPPSRCRARAAAAPARLLPRRWLGARRHRHA